MANLKINYVLEKTIDFFPLKVKIAFKNKFKNVTSIAFGSN